MAKKKKGGPTSAHPPASAGASASAPGRGISAAPPGARLVAEAAGLPGFWWRLHGIWEFVCGFLSRGVFWVVGDRKSAATHADAAGGLGGASSSATSHGDATRGARSSAASASDHRDSPRRGSAAAPKPAGPDVLGSSSPASSSKIATSGRDQSTAFHSDGAEEAADSAQFLEAPGRITIKNSLMYTPLERQQLRPPPPPAPPLQVVDRIEVPRDQEMLYREYSRHNRGCQGKSSICHMCFFEAKRSPNYTVRNCEMAGHCLEKHGEIGTPCEDRECQVRFRKDSHREGRLHLHFCHPLAN